MFTIVFAFISVAYIIAVLRDIRHSIQEIYQIEAHQAHIMKTFFDNLKVTK